MLAQARGSGTVLRGGLLWIFECLSALPAGLNNKPVTFAESSEVLNALVNVYLRGMPDSIDNARSNGRVNIVIPFSVVRGRKFRIEDHPDGVNSFRKRPGHFRVYETLCDYCLPFSTLERLILKCRDTATRQYAIRSHLFRCRQHRMGQEGRCQNLGSEPRVKAPPYELRDPL